MTDWLVLLVVVLVVPVALMGTAAAVAAGSLRRANRVLPGRFAANPPLWWLWSPGAAAVVHRRLRYICQLTQPVASPGASRPHLRRRRPVAHDAISELADEVISRAVALDRELLAAHALTRGLPRARALSDLDSRARALESSAHRVQQLAARRSGSPYGGGVSELTLDQRISAMEDAFSELGAVPNSRADGSGREASPGTPA